MDASCATVTLLNVVGFLAVLRNPNRDSDDSEQPYQDTGVPTESEAERSFHDDFA